MPTYGYIFLEKKSITISILVLLVQQQLRRFLRVVIFTRACRTKDVDQRGWVSAIKVIKLWVLRYYFKAPENIVCDSVLMVKIK